jgi:hypothetical protein
MDDRWFDNVVRSFARRRSRRGIVGGLVGAGAVLLASHLRLPGAAARIYIPQGEACFDEAQCLPGLTCAWNGYGSAGAACCAYVGGPCDDSFGCCDTAECFGGVCADFASAPVHGDPCGPGGNPCVYASGGVTCAWVEFTQDFRCCADQGGNCGWDGECCGETACVDGVCRAKAGGSGVGTSGAAGEWCGYTYCASSQWCCNASCGICVSSQGACTDDVCVSCPGCDSGLCYSNGYCAP